MNLELLITFYLLLYSLLVFLYFNILFRNWSIRQTIFITFQIASFSTLSPFVSTYIYFNLHILFAYSSPFRFTISNLTISLCSSANIILYIVFSYYLNIRVSLAFCIKIRFHGLIDSVSIRFLVIKSFHNELFSFSRYWNSYNLFFVFYK